MTPLPIRIITSLIVVPLILGATLSQIPDVRDRPQSKQIIIFTVIGSFILTGAIWLAYCIFIYL